MFRRIFQSVAASPEDLNSGPHRASSLRQREASATEDKLDKEFKYVKMNELDRGECMAEAPRVPCRYPAAETAVAAKALHHRRDACTRSGNREKMEANTYGIRRKFSTTSS